MLAPLSLEDAELAQLELPPPRPLVDHAQKELTQMPHPPLHALLVETDVLNVLLPPLAQLAQMDSSKMLLELVLHVLPDLESRLALLLVLLILAKTDTEKRNSEFADSVTQLTTALFALLTRLVLLVILPTDSDYPQENV